MTAIIAIDARLVPVLSLSRKKSGKPNRRAAAKHTICRLVRLKATFVLTLDKSLGTGIHFHTWIFVIVEWADRHSIATHTNTI